MRRATRWILGTLAAVSVASGAAWAAHHEKGEGKGKARGHHHGAKMFDQKDADGDGAISLEEWMAASEERFGRMDSDGDGSVTREEMKGAHEKMRERWKREKKGDDSDDEGDA